MPRQIDSYRHRREKRDDQPGDYSVLTIDGDRFALVGGPYVNDHAAALNDVAGCRRLVEVVNP